MTSLTHPGRDTDAPSPVRQFSGPTNLAMHPDGLR